MASDEPKIIIDEDWKARVQREKEEAARAPAGEPQEVKAEEEPESPFLALIGTLTMQAALALGMVAPRDSKEIVIDIGLAKWVIDVLMDLREKTRGNLAPGEQGHLTESISELQRVYVVRAQQAQEAAMKGPDLTKKGPGAK